MPEITELPDSLRRAAEAELEIVKRRVEGLSDQAERLHEMAEVADDELIAAGRLRRQLEEILGISQQMSISEFDAELRGQRLRQVAIQVLKRRRGESATVHYREWYGLVVKEGHRVAGKDPVATFLSQVSRSPEVEALGGRSGLYRLLAG